MTISHVKKAFSILIASFSITTFANQEISPEQIAMLETLPPDQRASIMEKMTTADALAGKFKKPLKK